MKPSFPYRAGIASTALEHPDYWAWCGSVIEADGRFHMFASCWPKTLPFTCWATHSQIWRAESESPLGPFTLQECVLGPTSDDQWDGSCLHNPNIQSHGGKFYLYYSGSVFKGDYPDEAEPEVGHTPQWLESWNGSRVGLAIADNIRGPWRRLSEPIVDVRPGNWDAAYTTNPSAVIHDDGSVLLMYKSITEPYVGDTLPGAFTIGLCHADSPEGPYAYISEEPLRFSDDCNIEDPFIWFGDGVYHMLAKDMNGTIAGEAKAGIYATSSDGEDWMLGDPAKAYSLTVDFPDGMRKVPFLERPHFLAGEDGTGHLYLATGESDGHYAGIYQTSNIVIPVKASGNS